MKVQLINPKGVYLNSVEWDGKSPIGQYVTIGDPFALPAYYANGGWVQGEPDEFEMGDATPAIVSKTRFLELLGEGAEKFQLALLTVDDKQILAKLQVAEKYLDSAAEIDLGSGLLKAFVEMLVQNQMITADHAANLLKNQLTEGVV